jgi:hypothetical protein
MVETQDIRLRVQLQRRDDRLLFANLGVDALARDVATATSVTRALRRCRTLQRRCGHGKAPGCLERLADHLLALIPPAIQASLREDERWARLADERSVRLFLSLDAALQDLPWELIQARLDVCILRCAPTTARRHRPASPLLGPLQVLSVRLDAESICPAARPEPDDNDPWGLTMTAANLDQVREHLAQDPCHVLEYRGRAAVAGLLFDAAPQPTTLDVLEIRAMLAQAGARMLVLIPLANDSASAMLLLAERLATLGELGCLVFRHPLDADQLGWFRRDIYPRLAAGEPPEVAIRDCRASLTLSLGSNQPMIFRLPGSAAVFSRNPVARMTSAPDIPLVSMPGLDLTVSLQGEPAIRSSALSSTVNVDYQQQFQTALPTPYSLNSKGWSSLLLGEQLGLTSQHGSLNQKWSDSHEWMLREQRSSDTARAVFGTEKPGTERLDIERHGAEQPALRLSPANAELRFLQRMPIAEWVPLTIRLRLAQTPMTAASPPEHTDRRRGAATPCLGLAPGRALSVTVILSAPGLDVYPQRHAELSVSDDAQSRPFTFWLLANAAGATTVRLDYLRDGAYLANAELRIDIAPTVELADRDLTLDQQGLDLWPGDPAADVTLIAHCAPKPDGTALSVALARRDGRIVAPCPMRLLASPRQWMHERLAAAPDAEPELGRGLFALLPPPIQQGYRALTEADDETADPASLLVVADEPWLPWEAMTPADADGNSSGVRLCERFALARWAPGRRHRRAPVIDRAQILVISRAGAPEGRLSPGRTQPARTTSCPPLVAHDETMTPASILRAGGCEVHLDHVFKPQAQAISRSMDFDLLHIIERGPGGRRSQRPGELARSLAAMLAEAGGAGHDGCIVVLDIRRAGDEGSDPLAGGEWASAWLDIGCRAVVTSLRPVDEAWANRFFNWLYEDLAAPGLALGEALRRANLRLRREVADTDAARSSRELPTYTLFGHPLMHLMLAGIRS